MVCHLVQIIPINLTPTLPCYEHLTLISVVHLLQFINQY